MTDPQLFGRRGAMTLLGGGAGAALAMTAALPVAADARTRRRSFDFSQAADRARVYCTMRCGPDDGLVIGFVSGRYYGVVDAELTPLFGVAAATFSRYRPLPDGSIEGFSYESAYFTDPVSGEAMDAYDNPYTGERGSIPDFGYRPARFLIMPDLDLKLGRPVPGLDFQHKVHAPVVRGDDLWMTEVTRTASAAPGKGKPFRYSESTTLHARLSELEAAGDKHVRCETSFTNVVGWRPWLNMGDRPGHMMAIGSGRYGAKIEDLPQAWLAATPKHHPEILADPAKILQPLWDAK